MAKRHLAIVDVPERQRRPLRIWVPNDRPKVQRYVVLPEHDRQRHDFAAMARLKLAAVEAMEHRSREDIRDVFMDWLARLANIRQASI